MLAPLFGMGTRYSVRKTSAPWSDDVCRPRPGAAPDAGGIAAHQRGLGGPGRVFEPYHDGLVAAGDETRRAWIAADVIGIRRSAGATSAGDRDCGVDEQAADVMRRIVALAGVADHVGVFPSRQGIGEAPRQPDENSMVMIQQRLVQGGVAELPVKVAGRAPPKRLSPGCGAPRYEAANRNRR